MQRSLATTGLLTALAMVFFAANSVLGRLALTDEAISPADYTAVRLVSGAVTLALLVWWRSLRNREKLVLFQAGSVVSATALFFYAAAFSFAYLSLEAGMGALILFACVQVTMIGWALFRGERPGVIAWAGLVIAMGAFVWLVSPGLQAPDPVGAALMVIAGIAWAVYSLMGRGATDPLAATAGNFLISVPITLGFWLLLKGGASLTTYGLLLALASGIISSAIGYAIWYTALAGLSRSQAGIVQLSVPVIAAAGGVLFLSEPITLRLAIASLLILGGIAMVILAPSAQQDKKA
jgi:drug/metabolite transporter (DMT)-like permease